VTLKGKPVKFDWVNPHSWAYVEVKTARWKTICVEG